MSSDLRNAIRSKVFSQKPKSKLVPLEDGNEDGPKVEVRQPRVGDMIDGMDAPSGRHRIARMIINSCYVPGTEEKVFDEADFDMLMDMPAGSVYAGLIGAVESNIDLKVQEAEAKKP